MVFIADLVGFGDVGYKRIEPTIRIWREYHGIIVGVNMGTQWEYHGNTGIKCDKR